MSESAPGATVVSVVDDDDSVRDSLRDLLRAVGYGAYAFASPEEFLTSAVLPLTRCLILDVAMPGTTGPELQEELARRQLPIPIVFLTAQDDERLRQRLLAAGAVAVLLKPATEAALLDAVAAALQRA